LNEIQSPKDAHIKYNLQFMTQMIYTVLIPSYM